MPEGRVTFLGAGPKARISFSLFPFVNVEIALVVLSPICHSRALRSVPLASSHTSRQARRLPAEASL